MRTKLKMIFAFILLAAISACSSDDNSTIEENDNSNEIETDDIKIEVKLKGMFSGAFSIEKDGESVYDYKKLMSVKIGEIYPDAHIREFYVDSTFIVEEKFKTLDNYFVVGFIFTNNKAVLGHPKWEDWESSEISITTEIEGIRETVLDTVFTVEETSFIHYERIYPLNN